MRSRYLFCNWLGITEKSLHFVIDRFKNKKFWRMTDLNKWSFKGPSIYLKTSKSKKNYLSLKSNVFKKGKSFMPVDERIKIIRELKCVDYVIKAVDKDRAVRETIRILDPVPTYFCNGGDQNNNSIPEVEVCEELGIELRDGFGNKIQSSSWLIKKAKEEN